MVEKVKLGILDACVCKYIWIKKKLSDKLNILLLKIGLTKTSSCQNIDNLWFRCRIISIQLLVFRASILLDTNTKLLIITELTN